jgi:ATP-dependent protease HslVU (ClpYQ) peptidase subunit
MIAFRMIRSTYLLTDAVAPCQVVGMTAIVGLSRGGAVFIGGDSAGVSGLDLTVRADTKVFRRGGYLFGFTTSFRMGQLIRYTLEVPPPKKNLDRFMSTTFVDALRECLKTGGWARKEEEQEVGGTFLVGVRGRLYEVHGDYQIAKPADGFAAVGCGDQVALGALYATAGRGMRPRARVKLALRAAERFNAGVRGPFTCKKV